MNILKANQKKTSFFVERGFDDASLLRILANASFEAMPEGAIVFKEHDKGEKFYIILHGSVSVMKPNQKFHDSKRRMRKLKRRIVDYITRLDGLLEKKNRSDDQEDDLIYVHYRLLQERVKLANARIHSRELSRYKELGHLDEGRCFGELSLLSGQPRDATIITRETSYFLTISEEDFYTHIKRKEKQYKEVMVEFFKNV